MHLQSKSFSGERRQADSSCIETNLNKNEIGINNIRCFHSNVFLKHSKHPKVNNGTNGIQLSAIQLFRVGEFSQMTKWN